MGWYIRKSLTRGPVRFNLSKGGLGLSVGVKGARIGVGPKGTYVFLGRNGLYYRQYFNTPIPDGIRETRLEPTQDQLHENEFPLPAIAKDSSAAELIQQLQVKYPAPLGYRIAFGVCILTALILFATGTIKPVLLFGLLALVFGLLSLPHRRPTVVMYDLDELAQTELKRIHETLETLGQCGRVWFQFSTVPTLDWKRNAGATELVKRQTASFVVDDQTLINANVPIPKIQSTNLELWILPDQAILRSSGRLSGVTYSGVVVRFDATRFIENEQLPSDAQVVGKTWQYVNRNGGPDRRFSNNRQLPIALYGKVKITEANGWSLELETSTSQAAQQFEFCWRELARLHSSVNMGTSHS